MGSGIRLRAHWRSTRLALAVSALAVAAGTAAAAWPVARTWIVAVTGVVGGGAPAAVSRRAAAKSAEQMPRRP